MKAEITIRHTRADGTLLDGSRKGDGVWEILKGLRDNWRYMPSIRAIGIGQSRDSAAQAHRINRAAEVLRQAGHTVTVEIDETVTRSFAEAEAERYERAEDRADRMAEYAGNATQRSAELYGRARQMGDAIPFGQPMMPDHYSYGRDKRYRERITRTYERSFAEADKAEHYERRAENAERYRAHRESVPVTLRRIAKLEADKRRFERALAGRIDYVRDEATGEYKLKRIMPGEAYRARLERERDQLAEQIEYWQGVVRTAEEERGVKVWGPADFTKGDFAQGRWGWVEVLRVNPKSITHPWGSNAVHLDVVTRDNVTTAIGGKGWTGTAPYDEVTGRMSAAEMAEHLAGRETSTA